jgi:tryptophanyl-tRNA synthetase
MQIITDSTPMKEPKDPDTCHVFSIYKLLGSQDQVSQMRKNYEGGNYGYGHAKQELFELILDKFKVQREKFDHYINNLHELEEELQKGEKKATEIAAKTLLRVKKKLGFA